jgi:chromatin remodeling complex protein RSC6
MLLVRSPAAASAAAHKACAAGVAHVPIPRKSSIGLQGDDMAKKASARKPNAAFMKPMTPSAKLGVVIGTKPMPRTEVTKKLWAYIKKNGLQDKKNKRMIKADEPLKAVFGGKATVNMFEMTKLVSKHLS